MVFMYVAMCSGSQNICKKKVLGWECITSVCAAHTLPRLIIGCHRNFAGVNASFCVRPYVNILQNCPEIAHFFQHGQVFSACAH